MVLLLSNFNFKLTMKEAGEITKQLRALVVLAKIHTVSSTHLSVTSVPEDWSPSFYLHGHCLTVVFLHTQKNK